MKITLLLILIIAATSVEGQRRREATNKRPPPSPEECKMYQRQMDRDMYKILIMGDMRITSFSSKEDMDQRYCRPFPTYLKSFSKFSKCLQAFSRQLMTILVKNIKSVHKSICYNDEKLAQAYSHVKCMDSDTKLGLAQTVVIVTSFANWASELKDVDHIIPAICCGKGLVKAQCRSLVNDMCAKKTGPETSNYIVDIVYSAFSDVFDMMCGKFPDENSCQKHVPQLYRELKDALKNVVNYNHTLSIPLVKVIQRLDGQVTIDG